MEYVYQEVPSGKRESSTIIFCRQIYVTSAIWALYFILGIHLGAPTVFVPQLRREANSTAAVSDETASSISISYCITISFPLITFVHGAVFGLSGTPWIYISAYLTLRYGKKLPLMIMSLITLSGVIVFYCSTSLTHIFISEVLMGLIGASQVTLYMAIISEYCSPKYRGLFLTIKSASVFWGIWVSNAIGTFFHWKYIGLLSIICAIYPILLIPFFPESPYFLASVGRFDECIQSHRWLRGTDGEAEKELKSLMESTCLKKSSALIDKATFISKIRAVEFYKPVLVSILLLVQYNVSGKLVCVVFAIDVIKKITGSESTAYIGMLILDGVSVLSTYIGCILAKIYRRKVLLILFSSVTCILLFITSIYLFLINQGIIIENAYISIALLSVYSISVCLGPIVLCTSIIGEMLPLKCRILAICICSTFERYIFAIAMKVGPYTIRACGLCAAFFAFGVMSSLTLYLVHLYVPETKDRTLQEIQDSMRGCQPRKFPDNIKELSVLKP